MAASSTSTRTAPRPASNDSPTHVSCRRCSAYWCQRARSRVPGRCVLEPVDRAHELAGVNFRLVEAPFDCSQRIAAPGGTSLPHREDALVHGFDVFRSHLAVEERSGGLRKIRIRTWDGALDRCVDSSSPPIARRSATTRSTTATCVRCVQPRRPHRRPPTTSMFVPAERAAQGEPVLGGFDSPHYATDTLRAPARDGAHFPSLSSIGASSRSTARRRCCSTAMARTASRPIPPSSSMCSLARSRFRLCDRACPRRPGTGPRWYENGRLLTEA